MTDLLIFLFLQLAPYSGKFWAGIKIQIYDNILKVSTSMPRQNVLNTNFFQEKNLEKLVYTNI